MPFNDATIRELKRELVRCEERAAILRELIGEATAPVPTPQPQPQRRNRSKRVARSRRHARADGGFREAIRQLIRQRPGIKRAEITETLKQTGVATNGRTSLSTRVYNDLWRMEKAGKIHCAPDGGYSFTEAA